MSADIFSDYLRLLDDKDKLQRRCDALSEELQRARRPTVEQDRAQLSPNTGVSVPGQAEEDLPKTQGGAEGAEAEAEAEAYEIKEAAGRLLVDERGVSRESSNLRTELTTGYMGDCSGAAFYSALMETLPAILSPHSVVPPHPPTAYQTWDSRPLPLSLSSPYSLPPLPLTRHLVSIFFHNCSDTLHLLDQAEFHGQIEAIYAVSLGPGPGGGPTRGEENMHNNPYHTAVLSQLYLVLAIGCLHVASPTSLDRDERSDFLNVEAGERDFPGMNYFAKANLLIPSLHEYPSLPSATTLALVAYYLLAVSHRDAAYTYVSGSVSKNTVARVHC